MEIDALCHAVACGSVPLYTLVQILWQFILSALPFWEWLLQHALLSWRS